jgi:hypothetical protein
MDSKWIIPVAIGKGGKSGPSGKREWSYFLAQKLGTPAGFLFLFLICVGIGVGIAVYGLIFGILTLVVLLGVPIVYTLVAYPRIGITIFISMAYLLMWIYRMGIPFPLGTVMDGMEVLFLLGLFIHLKRNRDLYMLKGQITNLILVWMVYNIVEVANPFAASRVAWVFTVRTIAVVMIMYFIFLYNIRTKEFIRFLLKLWLGFAFFAAAYCFKQEHFGFFPFEERYLHSDPNIAYLLFLGGTWRKFSIFSDPVVYAYTMAFSSLLCFCLMTGPFSKAKKWGLLLLACFYIMNMLYSGTRGAYVLIPAGMLLFCIIKYNKYILIAASVFAVIMVVVIYIPTSNYTLFRFQSAFKPSEDASYKLRKFNQKRIQPYIISHPLGGGLGSTGEWGERFSPGTYLAHFAPDSGYIRVAVEMGSIGLFLILLLMYTILKTGINNYYSIRDPELKTYCFAMVVIIFAFHIANFPQEALVQFPSNVNFYLVTSLIIVTKRIDNQQNKLADGV